MKFIFTLLLVSSAAFAQPVDRCTKKQILNTGKISKRICNDHINEFASRSSASCIVSKIEKNICRAVCKDAEKKLLANLRVDMTSDCGRQIVHYHKMGIHYYR